jgi:predicted Fe-Mo cluster-binding NifX family protein
MRLAVASMDGYTVDLHFGQAVAFYIYEVDDDAIRQEDFIEVEKYCNADPTHKYHEARFQGIAQALRGCDAVVSVRIGDTPRKALADVGIAHVEISGPVSTTLRKAVEKLREDTAA